MPREISDSASRKKDKHSSRDKDYSKTYEAADEFYRRKSVGKSFDDRTPSKRGIASGQSSGQKRLFLEHEENCFASEYDDYDDSKKFVQNSVQPHSRNGLFLPGIPVKHSLVDYDDESSDSDSSSESFAPQYPAGKGTRRKSSVQVVSASVKADLNELRQQTHQQSDSTTSRHIHLPSNSSKNKTESANSNERSDKKRHKHSAVELPEPVCKTQDIPVSSPKRQHSKEHRVSRKSADEEHDLPSDQINGKKTPSVDKPEKPSALKSSSKEKDTKHAKRRDSEAEIVSSNLVHSEKSKTHKKSKKHEASEEQLAEDKSKEQRSRTNAAKLPSTTAAGFKEEKSQKLSEGGSSHSKTSEDIGKHKKTSKHLDSIKETKSLSHGSFSVQLEDKVVKLSSDDQVIHKKREKEKHSSKKKSHAAEDSDSNKKKEKKDRSVSKHGTQSSGSQVDEPKDKRSKEKSSHAKREREFSDEGQISSDSSTGHVKESKHKHRSNGSLRNQSNIPVKSSKNVSSSLSRKTVFSDDSPPDR